MYRTRRVISAAAVLLSLLVLSCSIVPITGRRQLNLIPLSTITSLSFEEYSQFVAAHKVSSDAAQVQRVERVGRRIQGAVENFFASQGNAADLQGYQWEYKLIEDPQVNAWCMAGGKVVVYTGILPVVRDDAGLATVMGHEIAHAVANHGSERMSQGLLAQMGGMALEKALETKPAETRQLFMTAFGIGAQVGVMLPYSRLQESEADRLGMVFMAMAGYDPQQALAFWERMAAKGQGTASLEFLSTHPSDETRMRKLRELLPEAMQYYRKR